jgi:DNA-binding SARP family transcriptional activator
MTGGLVIILRSLGTAEIETTVTVLTPSQEVVFAAALYLILERGKRISRARLASLLWPSVPEKIRSHRLRQTVLQLKKLGIRLVADRDNLQLTKQDARSDSDDLSLNHPALSAPQGSLEFLPGYTPRLSEAFRDWVDAKRAEVHAAATSTLVHELEQARLRADWTAVEKNTAACLALDPYNETAILAQAEAAAMRGGKRKAMSILDRYIAEVGIDKKGLQLPATLLRRRISERVPDRPALINADPPFVGREREVELLTRRFGEARHGKGSATILVGEPGIGKTRLCAEVVRFAELQGAQVQRAACRRTDVDRPLSLFADIVPQLREMPGALGCAPESFVALKRLTELEERPQEVLRQADSEMLFYTLRTALFDLVDSVCEERCLFVLIEDVQWLDDASAKILIRMVERCENRRLFFLFNARPTKSALIESDEKARVNVLTLAPLMPSASETLLHSVALRPGDQPQPDFVKWCLTVAEGNPFFLQELAHQWIETGQRHEATPSIARVLEERLSRLGAQALHVVQTCAVLDEHSTVDRVERVLGYTTHEILSAIEELSKAAMLRSDLDRPDTSDGLLRPRHDFLSSAALKRLAPISLSLLHRRVADILEQEISQGKPPTTLLWACANHRHSAGDRTRALALSLSCAEHLLELGLANDACTGFQRSLDYCLTDAERLNVLPRLALAFELAAEWEKSKEALTKCVALGAKQDPETGRHNRYELLLLDARHRSALDFTSLLEETTLCVQSENASVAHRVEAAVLAMKVAVDFGGAQILNDLYTQIFPLLNRPEVSERTRLEVQMIYRTELGDGLVPLEDLNRFAEVTRSDGSELGYSRALVTASTACRLSGRYAEGLELVAKASDHAAANNLHSRHLEIVYAAVQLHISAEQFERADEAHREVARYPLPSDNSKLRNEMHCHDARIALELGDAPRALAAFGAIEPRAPTFSVTRKGYYLALEIRIRLLCGAVDGLESLVDELEATHRQMRSVGSQDFEIYSLYLALCAIGEKARGKALARDYVLRHRRSRGRIPSSLADAVRLDDGLGSYREESSTSAPPDSRLRSSYARA